MHIHVYTCILYILVCETRKDAHLLRIAVGCGDQSVGIALAQEGIIKQLFQSLIDAVDGNWADFAECAVGELLAREQIFRCEDGLVENLCLLHGKRLALMA